MTSTRAATLAALAAMVFVAAGVSSTGSGQAAETPKTLTPFNGKDLTGWKLRDPAKSQWKVGTASIDPANPKRMVLDPKGTDLVNLRGGCDLMTEAEFGDCLVTLEVMIPKESNSGVYLMGRYEVQIIDSFGKDADFGPGDMGGIYHTAAPVKPKFKAPGEWQTMEIVFKAPRFDAAGKRTAKAKFVKVVLNGQAIHENVEVEGPTGGELGPEVAKGPLMLQGDHGPVAFRNIKITLTE
jgi:hypothetical protein